MFESLRSGGCGAYSVPQVTLLIKTYPASVVYAVLFGFRLLLELLKLENSGFLPFWVAYCFILYKAGSHVAMYNVENLSYIQ